MDSILDLARWFGSAVCHQWPTHSYFVADQELPLCARCTGMYLGGLFTLLFLQWRHPRATGLPPAWGAVAMMLFFFAWGGDGVNSFIASFPSPIPPLYQPQNILRLTTGSLMGISLGTLIFVVFNSMVWLHPSPERVLATPREFIALLAVIAVLIVAVNSTWSLLLTPLALASLLAILTLNSALMGGMVGSFMRRTSDGAIQAIRPLALGLLVALFYLDGIAILRVALGNYLGYKI